MILAANGLACDHFSTKMKHKAFVLTVLCILAFLQSWLVQAAVGTLNSYIFQLERKDKKISDFFSILWLLHQSVRSSTLHGAQNLLDAESLVEESDQFQLMDSESEDLGFELTRSTRKHAKFQRRSAARKVIVNEFKSKVATIDKTPEGLFLLAFSPVASLSNLVGRPACLNQFRNFP
jgi:hypothetical protein